jgi:hypothetical protein
LFFLFLLDFLCFLDPPTVEAAGVVLGVLVVAGVLSLVEVVEDVEPVNDVNHDFD